MSLEMRFDWNFVLISKKIPKSINKGQEVDFQDLLGRDHCRPDYSIESTLTSSKSRRP